MSQSYGISKTLFCDYLRSSKLENAENIIRMLKNISAEYIQIDDIGKNFENSLSKIERKDKGQYYTSSTIVQYMIRSLNIKDTSKTLDPTCGCGSFTLGLYNYLEKKYGISSFQNIFGVDLNHNAVDIARLCLFVKSIKSQHNILQKNIQVGNSIVNDDFDWQVHFKSILDDGGFDVIIGNPPYGIVQKKDFNDPEYSEINKNSVNIASLLIVKSLNLLKDGGKLAFLLPKSLLHVISYRHLRQYILEKSIILQICDLGSEFPDVRGEQVILFLQKKNNFNFKPKKTVISVGITTGPNGRIKPTKKFDIDYSSLNSNRFLTLDNPKHYGVLNRLSKINDTIPLLEFVKNQIFRGISLNSEDQKTISERRMPNSVKILRGKSISKYKILKPYYIEKTKLRDNNYKKIQNFNKKPKIILQNIFSSESGIIASFDDQNIITLDTVTNVIVDNSDTGKYLLGLFNSKLINFYLMFGLFNRSKLTMHTDKKYLGSIPILNNPNTIMMEKITYLAGLCSKNYPHDVKKVTRMIDEQVFKLYGVSKKDIRIITDAVDDHLSDKSKW